MGLIAQFSEGLASEQRGTARRTLRLEVAGDSHAGQAVPMTIHDLSATGLLVQTDEGLPVGEKLHIELPEAGRYPAKVMWSSGRFVGCKFDRPLAQAAISAALLRSVQPGTEQRIEAAGASRAVQKMQARVQQLVHGPADVGEAEAGIERQSDRADDRLPLHVRGRILIGLGAASAGAWALILWGVGLV